MKETKDNENYKPLKREIKKTSDGKIFHAHGSVEST
jgi:hypothetical protein